MRCGVLADGLALLVSSCEEASSAAGVPHAVILSWTFELPWTFESLRQMRVGPWKRMPSPSVVSVGSVQVRTTLLPLRIAWRSETGVGNSSEGGKGGLGAAQPTKKAQRASRGNADFRLQIAEVNSQCPRIASMP